MKIVVTPPFTEEQKALILCEAERPEDVIFCLKSDMTEELLREADVLLGNLESPGQLEKTEHLKWIQLNNAGTEGYCVPGRLPQGAVLTNATGAYGLAISEHMLACLFMLRKKLNLYYANQLQSQWKSEGHVGVIQGTTVLVIGLGDIGTCFASKMKALGCTTIGVKRRVGEKPDCVDVGRGTAVDTDALSDALYAGKIAGAALDVTDPEPLPADHPLWKAPNAIITPHISGGYALPETLQQIAEIFAENLKRFQAGEPLRNVVDLETGYCK